MSLHQVQTGSGRLAGKVAIVTGAASGFGLAIAKSFIHEGAKVVACDLNNEALQKQFSSDADTHLHAVVADVTKAADWKRIVDDAVHSFGGLDILVNNAGTSYRNKVTLEVTEDEFDRVFLVNVKSIYLSIPAVHEHMKARGGGSIINIASIGALRPRPGLVWYNASKGAVSNATKGLAAEFGKDKIRINAICPLLSGTGLFEQFVGVPFTPENVDKFLFNVPMGRLAEAQDIANACVFLGSDEGGFITGTDIPLDGGRSVGA